MDLEECIQVRFLSGDLFVGFYGYVYIVVTSLLNTVSVQVSLCIHFKQS